MSLREGGNGSLRKRVASPGESSQEVLEPEIPERPSRTNEHQKKINEDRLQLIALKKSEEEALTRRLLTRIGHVTHSRQSIVVMGHPRRKGAVSPTLTSPQMGRERENDHIGPHSLNSNDVEVGTSLLMPGGTSWGGDHNAASHISPGPGPNYLSPGLPKDPQIMAGSPQPDGKAADLSNAVASKLVEPRGENPYQEYTTIDQFYQLSALRRMAIRICSNPDFEMLVTLVIFSNCVTLCLYDPMQPTDSPHNQALNWAELGMNVFYTVEAVMRGLALGGFLNYIRVPWNAFDFSMVTIGYISILPIGGDSSGVRALRALRALRILRTITRFESLRAVVVCFLEAVPMLSAAFFLLISVLYFFGVAAVQCFNEAYHNICATEYNNSWLYENQGDDPDMFGCSTPTKEGWWWRECPTNYTCITTPESTAVNTAGFDNAGLAFLTNWQIMTLTGWNFIMFRTIDNSSPFAGIYTYLLVLVSAYFLVNLFLAVLKVKFAKAQTIFMAKKANASQTKAKNTFQKFFSSVGSRVSAMSQRSSRNSLMSQKLQSAINERLSVRSFSVAGSEDNGKYGGGLVRGLPSEGQSGGSKHRMPMSHQPASPAADSNKKVLVGEGTEVQRIGGAVGEGVEAQDKQVQPCGGRESELDRLDQLVSDSQLMPVEVMHVVEGRIEGKPLHQSSSVLVLPAPPPALSSSGTGTGGLGDGSQGSAFHQRSKQRLSVGIKFQGVPDDSEELAFKGGKRKGSESGSDVEEAGCNGQVAAASAGEEPHPLLLLLRPDGLVGPAVPEDATAAMTTMDLYEFSEFVSDLTWRQRMYLIMQFRAVRLAEHPNFDNFFLTVILANAMALAVDYYGAPYEHALTEANYAFTGLFTVEVVVKLFGFGFWKFMGDPFNVFDIIIVTLAYLEIILSSVQGLSALRALRALRVLRLLKMFRYLKSLRKIGEVLVSSFGSFASIMVVLIIFWLLFAIMGMHIFGGIYLSIIWPNFDTFFNSLVSTFNILNLENYQNQWGSVAHTLGWGPAAYYIIWILIGKYTCVHLFLAVMLEAFEAKYDGGIGAGGTLGSRAGSMISGLKQSLNSFRSQGSENSVKSIKEASPPDSPRSVPVPQLSNPQKAAILPFKSTGSVTLVQKTIDQGSQLASPKKIDHNLVRSKEVFAVKLHGLEAKRESPSQHNAFSPFSLDSARAVSSIWESPHAEKSNGGVPHPSANPASALPGDGDMRPVGNQMGEGDIRAREKSVGHKSSTVLGHANLRSSGDCDEGEEKELGLSDEVQQSGFGARKNRARQVLMVDSAKSMSPPTRHSNRSSEGIPEAVGMSFVGVHTVRAVTGPVVESVASSTAVTGPVVESVASSTAVTGSVVESVASSTAVTGPVVEAVASSTASLSTTRQLTMAHMRNSFKVGGGIGRFRLSHPAGPLGEACEDDVPEVVEGGHRFPELTSLSQMPVAPADALRPPLSAQPAVREASRRSSVAETWRPIPDPLAPPSYSSTLLGPLDDPSNLQKWQAIPPQLPPSSPASSRAPTATHRRRSALAVMQESHGHEDPLGQGLEQLLMETQAALSTASSSAGRRSSVVPYPPSGPREVQPSQLSNESLAYTHAHRAHKQLQQQGTTGSGPSRLSLDDLEGALAEFRNVQPSRSSTAADARRASLSRQGLRLSQDTGTTLAPASSVLLAAGNDSAAAPPPHQLPTPPTGPLQHQPGQGPLTASSAVFPLFPEEDRAVSVLQLREELIFHRQIGEIPPKPRFPQRAFATPEPCEEVTAMHFEMPSTLKGSEAHQQQGEGMTSEGRSPSPFLVPVLKLDKVSAAAAGSESSLLSGRSQSANSARRRETERIAIHPSGFSQVNQQQQHVGIVSAHVQSHAGAGARRSSEIEVIGSVAFTSSLYTPALVPGIHPPPPKAEAGLNTVGIPSSATSPTVSAPTVTAACRSPIVFSGRSSRLSTCSDVLEGSDLGAVMKSRRRSLEIIEVLARKETERLSMTEFVNLREKVCVKAAASGGMTSLCDWEEGVGVDDRAAAGVLSAPGASSPVPPREGGLPPSHPAELEPCSKERLSVGSDVDMSGDDSCKSVDSVEGKDSAGQRGRAGNQRMRRKGMSSEEAFRRRQSLRNGAVAIEGSGLAFWYFDEDHPLRVRVYDLVTNKYFDYLMFVVIILNCICMAMEGPFVTPGSAYDQFLNWSEVAFTIIFGVEAVLKIFAFTFTKYIKETQNQVDFFVLFISAMVLALQALLANASAAQGLRALRAVKPLRMLTRSAGMRMVFKSIVLSLAAMANVSLVLIIFFIIFAILGTQLFMGLLGSCNDTSVSGIDTCVGNFTENGVDVNRTWSTPFPNFDNVGNSLFTCFLVVTLNGYTQTMMETMDAPSQPGLQPQWMINRGAFFWYVAFVFIVAFCLLNLYIGVIFSQFTKIRQMNQGSAFLTNDQQEWAELTKMVFKLKPNERVLLPRNLIRNWSYRFAINPHFDNFIMFIVSFNLCMLSATHYGESQEQWLLSDQLNYFFTSVYILEALLKIAALGWKMYWIDDWNKFDMFLVLLAVLDIALASEHLNFLRALRVLRAQKLLRLLLVSNIKWVAKGAQNVKSMINVMVTSIPGFVNVMALIGLVIFMYAYVGVYFFGKVKWNQGINEHVNFENFGNAVIILIRTATMDNWVDILLDCMQTPGVAGCSYQLGTCGNAAAIPYFVTYIIIVAFILLSLFTAVIVETFEVTHNQEDWKLSPQALDHFAQLWSEYDDGSGTIDPSELEVLLSRLDPPLGLGPTADNKDVLRFVYDLDIPLLNGRVPFHKTAFELVKRVSQSKIPDGAIKSQLDKMTRAFLKGLDKDELLNFSTAVVVARIQRKWKAYIRAIKLRRSKAWRLERCQGNPWYSDIDEQGLGLRYRCYKEAALAQRWQKGGIDHVASETYALRAESRWLFNPQYNSQAVHWEAQAISGPMHHSSHMAAFTNISPGDMEHVALSPRHSRPPAQLMAGLQGKWGRLKARLWMGVSAYPNSAIRPELSDGVTMVRQANGLLKEAEGLEEEERRMPSQTTSVHGGQWLLLGTDGKLHNGKA